MPTVGVLALQGDFAAHLRMLEQRHAKSVEVRRAGQVAGLDALVLPGGESTTLLNLMQDEPWFEALGRFHEQGGALLATCAGAILLAREVEPAQTSLPLLDVAVRRNAYGRQLDSFEADLDVAGWSTPLRAVFIRAPRFLSLGRGVEVLARWQGEPVLVRQGRILAATFHPELAGDDRLHGVLLELISRGVELRGGGFADPPPGISSDRAVREVEGGRACGSM